MNPAPGDPDEDEARLQGQFPAHQVWYVRRDGLPPLWHAQRLPVLTAGSPGELAVMLGRGVIRRWLARHAALSRLAGEAERGGHEVSNAKWRELKEQARRIAG